MHIGHAIQIAIIAVLVAASWTLPRRLGMPGMFAAHWLAVGGWAVMACVALATGIWDDYDFLTVIGMLVQAFLFNCLMLPLSIWAMFKWKRKSPLSPRRADPSRAPVDA